MRVAVRFGACAALTFPAIPGRDLERNPSNPWGERHVALIDAEGATLILVPVPPDDNEPTGVRYGTHAQMRHTP